MVRGAVIGSNRITMCTLWLRGWERFRMANQVVQMTRRVQTIFSSFSSDWFFCSCSISTPVSYLPSNHVQALSLSHHKWQPGSLTHTHGHWSLSNKRLPIHKPYEKRTLTISTLIVVCVPCTCDSNPILCIHLINGDIGVPFENHCISSAHSRRKVSVSLSPVRKQISESLSRIPSISFDSDSQSAKVWERDFEWGVNEWIWIRNRKQMILKYETILFGVCGGVRMKWIWVCVFAIANWQKLLSI